jgi:hypothetical protein
LYSVQTWTLSKVDQKYLESFEVMVVEKDGVDQLDGQQYLTYSRKKEG